jgi:hypothetical protein
VQRLSVERPRRKQILAIAAAMAAVCASHPIPRPGARHRGNLFSVAFAADAVRLRFT